MPTKALHVHVDSKTGVRRSLNQLRRVSQHWCSRQGTSVLTLQESLRYSSVSLVFLELISPVPLWEPTLTVQLE